MQTVEIADAAAFERTLRRLAHQILENNPEPEQVLLVGILRRGVPLAATSDHGWLKARWDSPASGPVVLGLARRLQLSPESLPTQPPELARK